MSKHYSKHWDDRIGLEAEGPVVFQHDPLELSCESYLKYKHLILASLNHLAIRFHSLKALAPGPQAVDMAEQVRKFYLGQLSFQTLRDQPLSEFRKKLYAFLMGEYQLKQDELGLLYKLPYFWEHDTQVLEITEQTKRVPGGQYSLPVDFSEYLTPLKRVTRLPSSGESYTLGDRVTYWWRTQYNQAAIMDGGAEQGNFASLMDSLFKLGRELHFEGRANIVPVPVALHHQVWKIRQPRLVM